MKAATLIKILIIAMVMFQSKSRVVYPEGLWPMNSFGQFSSQNEQILAYYDFNRDRFVDILTFINSVTYQLRVYIFIPGQNTFVNQGSLDLGLFKPVTVIPGNIIQDGLPNIMLTGKISQSLQEMQYIIYSINCTNNVCKILYNTDKVPTQTSTLPTLLQIKGKNVILYTTNNKLRCQYYLNGKIQQSDFISQFFWEPTDALIQGICVNYLDVYYLDYNGDCFMDLVIHCNASAGLGDLQFYKANQYGLFVPDRVAYFGEKGRFLRTAIVDINFDGLVDVIQLIADSSGLLLLQIHYNTATKSSSTQCTTTSQQNYFPFQFVNSESELNSSTQALKIQRVVLNSYPQWIANSVISQNFYIRTGDINNDGFMDLIIDGPNRAMLYINQVCNNDNCGNYNAKFMQTWSLGFIRIFVERIIDGMANYNNKICSMSFFDIEQDGRLDLMSNLCTTILLQPQILGNILAIYNSLSIDAFFIKVMILQNLNNSSITKQNMDKKLNIPGVHVDFFVTALNGEKIPNCGNQLSHPGISLELPYIHTGLGRTNNYIEMLTVVISSNSSFIQKSWSPIVPNSQLIIIPGNKWVLETYISPTAVMAYLLIVVVIVLGLIGFWVTRLTRKEKIQDKENQESFYAILR